MDVKSHLTKSLWDQKHIRDVSEDKFVGEKQWPYNGAPTMLYEQSYEVSIKKEDNTDFQESPLDLSIRKDHCSNIPTVVPMPSFTSGTEIQQTVMAGCIHNQQWSSAQTPPNSDPQVYIIDFVEDNTKQIEEGIERYCPDVVQKIKTEPLYELQPVHQANLKLSPSPCYAPISPYDAAEPPPRLTSGENIPSTQLAPDLIDASEPSSAYSIPSTSYVQVPSFDFVDLAATHSAPATPTVQDIDPSEVYTVRETCPVDASQPQATKKPISKKRRRQIQYGSEFYCKICEKQFSRQSNLLQHLRLKHEEHRPFRCDICGKSYFTEQDMLGHRQNHDPSRKRHKCPSCEKSYRHMNDLDRHFATHHGTPTYVCEIEGCPKAFARRDHMLLHYETHKDQLDRLIAMTMLHKEKENKGKQMRRDPRED
nr:zinc finger protein 8 [Aedes albopictus]XP_019554730.2 zinc finger protein 8 [Aedes albopictus]